MKRYYKTGFWFPPGSDFNKLVEMFNYNNILVDDMCSVNSTKGRLVALWLEEEDLEETSLGEKVGSFCKEKEDNK